MLCTRLKGNAELVDLLWNHIDPTNKQQSRVNKVVCVVVLSIVMVSLTLLCAGGVRLKRKRNIAIRSTTYKKEVGTKGGKRGRKERTKDRRDRKQHGSNGKSEGRKKRRH